MHHLIFEGPELAGKSWLMSTVYDHLETKYNRSKNILDGCHWLNCDIGVYGTDEGERIIRLYYKIFNELKEKNLLVEKFHLSDIVYSRLHRKYEIDYYDFEKKLSRLDFKIVFCTFPEDESLIRKRLADRLAIYPHYERIMREPAWYIMQQREYLKELDKSILPRLIIQTENLPDERLSERVLKWLGEK